MRTDLDEPSQPTQQTPSALKLITYNIQSGRNGRLETALRALNSLNVDIGILTEAKLTKGRHTRYSYGYQVVATQARSASQGGVALVFRDSPTQGWQVESIRRYGPNVLSFQLSSGRFRYGVVGVYIPPKDVTTLEFVTQAMEDLPPGCASVLLGDLNVDLEFPRDTRGRLIATDFFPSVYGTLPHISDNGVLSGTAGIGNVAATSQWRSGSVSLRPYPDERPSHSQQCGV